MRILEKLGEGSESVYAYYFPSQQTDTVWPMKIGKTKGDPSTRVKTQQASMQEEPVIALVIKTDYSDLDEKRLHHILQDSNLQAYGTEWFMTNPETIKSIALKSWGGWRQLGIQFKQIRLNSDVTQVALAKYTGISRPCISHFENGKSIQSETLIRLAAALNYMVVLEPMLGGIEVDQDRKHTLRLH